MLASSHSTCVEVKLSHGKYAVMPNLVMNRLPFWYITVMHRLNLRGTLLIQKEICIILLGLEV